MTIKGEAMEDTAGQAETEFATADDLLAEDVHGVTREVRLAGGRVVLVRGMTRYELVMLSRDGADDSSLAERRTVQMCMVKPEMTMKQVEAWQKHSPAGGAFRRVTETIRDLSGLGEGADKSDV